MNPYYPGNAIDIIDRHGCNNKVMKHVMNEDQCNAALAIHFIARGVLSVVHR